MTQFDKKEIELLFIGIVIAVGITMFYDMFQLYFETLWEGKSMNTIGASAIGSLAVGFGLSFLYLWNKKRIKPKDHE